MAQTVLSANASLRGKDLSHVYNLAKNSEDPKMFAMFKKKEQIVDMPKSLLKHRIQALTGKSATDIEEEMGFPSTRAGGGVPIEVLKRLAHFLILDAMGQIDNTAGAPVPVGRPQEASPKAGTRKRGAPEPSPEAAEAPAASDMSSAAGPSSTKKARTSRKSLMPMASQPMVTPNTKRASRRSLVPELMFGDTTSVTETIGCKLGPKAVKKAEASKIVEEDEVEPEKESEPSVEDLGLGPNPTPMMIAQKRRSLAMTPKRNIAKVSPIRQNKVATQPPAQAVATSSRALEIPSANSSTSNAKNAATSESNSRRTSRSVLMSPAKVESTTVDNSIKASPESSGRGKRKSLANLAAPQAAFAGSDGCKIYLAEGNPSNLNHEICVKVAPGFTGANLTMLHTPVEWEPMDVFKFTKTVMAINVKAELESYLLLVGCGLSNASLFRDAILTQTKHVQFVVFDRADQNLSTHREGMKLRDTTSFFLLAYFFPGCNEEDSEPEEAMVRPGFTNVLQCKSTQDLEKKILFALSEKEDWILDVFCKNREISLAALATGRNAIAVDPSSEMLFCLKEKAAIEAEKYEKSFRKNIDGLIQTF